MRDHLSPPCPDVPDWDFLHAHWAATGLLRLSVSEPVLQKCSRGRVAFVATPSDEFEGGAALAAQYAAEWQGVLCALGVIPVTPAVMAQLVRDCPGPFGAVGVTPVDWPSILRATDIVIIPPMDGWRRSLDIWRVACAALATSKPVYTLKPGGSHD
jgi:hypothetical protein